MKHTPELPVPESRDVPNGVEGVSASYPAQTAAHLYFIASGLWLSARWIFRGSQPVDTTAERRGLQRRFSRYFELLRRWRMLEVDFVGFEDCETWRRTVIAPNHPSLLDAVALISRIPGLDCVMNSKLLRDPVMGGAARLCDYVCNSSPLRMLKTCESRLVAGANILIFPEGTRTVSLPLGSLHHGYALAAIRASAAIRTVFIECDSTYFGRAFSFFRPAKCPLRFRLTAGEVIHPSRGDDPREISRRVEMYYRNALVEHDGGVRLKSS